MAEKYATASFAPTTFYA